MVAGIVGLLVVLGLAAGQYIWGPMVFPSGPLSSEAARVGFIAPDFELATLAGSKVKLSDLRGHPVMINFWATWCPPCTDEMPAIQARYARHAPDLRVLAVDAGEIPGTVRPFVSSNGLTFDILLDDSGAVENLYNVTAYPTTFFVDAEGYIRSVKVGGLSESELDDQLKGIGIGP